MQVNYVLSIMDKNDLSKIHAQFQLPFLPRLGDNLAVGEEGYRVLQVNIDCDQIMITNPDASKKIVSINSPQPKIDPEILVHAVLIVDITSVETPKEN